MNHAILSLSTAITTKRPAVLATVIEVNGASPAKIGAQIVLLDDGTTAGTVGGGKLEAAILADAKTALAEDKPRLAHYRLTENGDDSIGTLCGGEARVFIQPFLPPPQIIIVGGGHVGRPLKTLAETAGFDVTVVDVEPGRADVPELSTVGLTADSFVVLITTDHIADEAALRKAIQSPAPYIGMIGSRHKCETILGHLRKDGISEETLCRVRAPIGLDLGGPTPAEIAVSILAEVIAVRRGGRAAAR
jgi:xanthine dehydrogenase accessory factor